jgi:hypothetical protein
LLWVFIKYPSENNAGERFVLDEITIFPPIF